MPTHDSSPTSPPPRALILKGGGVKGLAFAGAVRELEKHLPFDVFVGTSAGAIAAVLLAAGYSGAELGEELAKKNFREFVSEPWLRRLWGAMARGGLFTGRPIRAWVAELLERRIPDRPVFMRHLPKRAIIFASKRPQGTVAFDQDGDHDDTPADLAVRYSMSIPFFFQPLKLDDIRVYDGGVLSNFPLEVFLQNLPANLPKVDFVALYLADGELSPSRSTSMLRELFQLVLSGRERAVVDKHRENVLVMNPAPIRTTQFDLTDDEKSFLLAEGRAAALRYLSSKNQEWASPSEAEEARSDAEKLRTKVAGAAALRARRRRLRRWGAAAVVLATLALAQAGIRRLFLPDTQATETPTHAGPKPGVEVGGTHSPQTAPKEPAPAPAPASESDVPAWWVDPVQLSEAELRKYVGQLFLVGFESRFGNAPGQPADGLQTANSLVAEHGVGGVILFRYNVPPAEPTAERRSRMISFTDELQRMSRNRGTGIPLVVATDQEGGSTEALPPAVVTEMPAAMALGGLRRRGIVEDVGRRIGEELHLLGVNVNLAPVVDVNINQDNDLIRDRSFGGDPDFVTELARAWLRGSNKAGVLSVAKHFPGHGSTNEGIEKPREIPVSSHRSDQLKSALQPFAALAREGVAAIMTSHMRLKYVPQLHANVTFDRAVLDLLRQTGSRVPGIEPIGFDGVAITDDLGLPSVAPGIGQRYVKEVSRNVLQAFDAGHDLLMVAHVSHETAQVANYDKEGQQKGLTLDQMVVVMADLERHVFDETGDEGEHDLRIGRFRESLGRILSLKRRIPAPPSAVKRAALLEAKRDENSRRADELFRMSFATLPQGGPCPSFQLGPADQMLLVFPVRGSQGVFERAKAEKRYAQVVASERQDWLLLKAFDKEFGKRTDVRLELEEYLPQKARYERRAREIADIVRRERPKLVLFFVVNTNHAQQLATVLRHLENVRSFDLARVVVIVTGQPNVLSALTNPDISPDLINQPTYLFAYTGWRNSIERADRLLAETLASLNPGECPGSGNRPPIYIRGINDTPGWQLEN